MVVKTLFRTIHYKHYDNKNQGNSSVGRIKLNYFFQKVSGVY